MKKTYRSDSLFLIQSLGEADIQTGFLLAERIKEKPVLQSNAFFKDVVDKEAFLNFLKKIERGIDDGSWEAPIIHIECHGYIDGSGLKLRIDGIEWSEVAPVLTRIKRKSKNNLLLVFGACFSLSFLMEFSMFKPSYCSVLLGVDESVYPSGLDERFYVFYEHILLKSGSANKAVALMNEGYTAEDGLFRIYPTVRLLNAAINAQKQLVEDPTSRRKWAEELKAKPESGDLTVDQIEQMLIAQSQVSREKAIKAFTS